MRPILRALAVDPDEAADVAEAGVSIPISFDDFARSSRLTDALITISEFVRWRKDTRSAVRQISSWSPRLGVWCACAMADVALAASVGRKKLDSGGFGARKAIDACRDYARMTGTPERAIKASAIVIRMNENRKDPILHAASAIGVGIEYLEKKNDLYWFSAYMANVWAGASNSLLGDARSATPQMRDNAHEVLTDVVADACLTFPVRVSSSGATSRASVMPALAVATVVAGAMFMSKRA